MHRSFFAFQLFSCCLCIIIIYKIVSSYCTVLQHTWRTRYSPIFFLFFSFYLFLVVRRTVDDFRGSLFVLPNVHTKCDLLWWRHACNGQCFFVFQSLWWRFIHRGWSRDVMLSRYWQPYTRAPVGSLLIYGLRAVLLCWNIIILRLRLEIMLPVDWMVEGFTLTKDGQLDPNELAKWVRQATRMGLTGEDAAKLAAYKWDLNIHHHNNKQIN